MQYYEGPHTAHNAPSFELTGVAVHPHIRPQVSSKRFCDNVPMHIRRQLLIGFVDRHRECFFNSLMGTSVSADGAKDEDGEGEGTPLRGSVLSLMQEDAEVARRRTELQAKAKNLKIMAAGWLLSRGILSRAGLRLHPIRFARSDYCRLGAWAKVGWEEHPDGSQLIVWRLGRDAIIFFPEGF
jgi:hypothetical protein